MQRTVQAAIVAMLLALMGTASGLGRASVSAGNAPPRDSIALNSRGTAHDESADPVRFVYTLPLYSLVTGRQIGTAVDEATCVSSTPPPCAVVDDTQTFHMPEGDIVSHALVSVVPDPQRPGFILTGSRPSANTIVKATGLFAGRTGVVRESAVDDARAFPGTIVEDAFWVIDFA